MKYLIQLILALFTLALMGWVAWQIFELLKKEQLGLDAATRPVVIIAAALALIVSFMITMAIGNHSEKNVRARLYPARLTVYEKCLAIWDTVTLELPPDPPAHINLQVTELEAQLALVASSKVLKAFQGLKRLAGSGAMHSADALEAKQKMILTMREDLGQASDYLFKKELQNLLK